jgi:hypothetical protein
LRNRFCSLLCCTDIVSHIHLCSKWIFLALKGYSQGGVTLGLFLKKTTS